MTYLEKMKEATSDFERAKVVEEYTLEFATIANAAGLETPCGYVQTADGEVWVSYTSVPASELLDIISAITTADQSLGERASELHGDILGCANFTTAIERKEKEPRPVTKEEVAAALEPDPDAETYAWLCPHPVNNASLDEMALITTPIATLHDGKILHLVRPIIHDEDGNEVEDANEFVPTLVIRDDYGDVCGVSGYHVHTLSEFRDRFPVEPRTMEEIKEQEYNPELGYFHHARVKHGRKVYVLVTYATYANEAYLVDHHPAWQDEDEGEGATGDGEILAVVDAVHEPSTLTIELDEEGEPAAETVPDPAPAGQDELERLCRLLYAVKEEKKQTDADFNESIKNYEDQIKGLIARRDQDRYQRRLPLETVPDDQAEEALDAAAEESQETAPEAPVTAMEEKPSNDTDNSEPDESGPVPPADGGDSGDTDPPGIDFDRFPQCEGCYGSGEVLGDTCPECNGEGVSPAVRESPKDGLLECALCGKARSFWAFVKYENGRKGHICNVCRKPA